jgi:hypothetical protein
LFLSKPGFGTGGLRGIMGVGTNRINKYTIGMEALYGLKQAPRAWYSRLDKYLQQAGFIKGNILLIEVYVDDIIFGSDDDRLS